MVPLIAAGDRTEACLRGGGESLVPNDDSLTNADELLDDKVLPTSGEVIASGDDGTSWSSLLAMCFCNEASNLPMNDLW